MKQNIKQYLKQYHKDHYQKNKEKILEKCKKYRNENKEIVQETNRIWYQKNKEIVRLKHKEYYQKNKDRSKKYYQDNKEKIREQKRKYRENNREQFRKYFNAYNINRRKNDLQFRLNDVMSTNIGKALKHNKNGHCWESLVDYTLQDLIQHIEKQFDKNMSWENYGSYWHIDHIIPKSWFIYKTPEDIGFKMAWDLDNLQPLEASKNFLKGNKIV